jgi:hypothetical protein
MDIHEILQKLDPDLWRQQRLCLMELSDRWHENQARQAPPEADLILFTKEDDDAVQGLTNFLDAVTDYLADDMGRKKFLLTADPKARKPRKRRSDAGHPHIRLMPRNPADIMHPKISQDELSRLITWKPRRKKR